MTADVTKSVRISFNLNASFKQALTNINDAFNTIKTSAATVNTSLAPMADAINKIKESNPEANKGVIMGALKKEYSDLIDMKLANSLI